MNNLIKSGSNNGIKEKPVKSSSGYAMIFWLFIAQVLLGVGVVTMPPLFKIVFGILSVIVFICWFGFYMVQPNQGRVLLLFGEYVGTDKRDGLRWANPLYSKQSVSLRIRNFNSDTLKVNDNLGSPIEIGCVIVWKVVDTAEAVFQVDDYSDFVTIQSEAALRNLATSYPYDQHEDDEISLRSHSQEIAEKLLEEVQDRLAQAGVKVLETRISHLAYAQEIAHAMLQRQQATAIIAARQKIVQGAVGMVELALESLKEKGVVDLDEERKAAMVSNLLVVLCSDQNTQPIVNAGTLY